MEYIDFQVNIYFTLPLVHYFPNHYYPLSFIIILSHPLLSPLIHYYPLSSIIIPPIPYHPLSSIIIPSYSIIIPFYSRLSPLIHYYPLSHPLLSLFSLSFTILHYHTPFFIIITLPLFIVSPPPTSIIIPYCLELICFFSPGTCF